MPRTKLEISLPGPLADHVEARVAAGGYRDASDYLTDLVRRDRQARASADLDQSLREGLASGDAVPVTAESMDALEREVAAIVARRSAAAE